MRFLLPILLLCSSNVRATFVVITQPDASYTSGTQSLLITGPSGAVIANLTDGFQAVTFGSAGGKETTNSGNTPGYGNWGPSLFTEGPSTDFVCFISNSSNCNYNPGTQNDFTLSVPSFIFGFEVQPDSSGTYLYTLDFYSGLVLLGSISQNVSGIAGARLFAASSDIPITSAHITVPSASDGYAIARLRYAAAVPEPGTLLAVAASLCAIAFRGARSATRMRSNQ